MELSQRARAIPVSPIRRLLPLAEAAKRAGKTVYHLNIGQPDVPTPQEFLKGFQEADIDVLAYSPSQGLSEARRALAAYYQDQEIPLDPDQIVVTAGGSEAIVFALWATCDPGDEVLVPEPFYANYKSYAVISGVTLVPVTTRAPEGFHLPPRSQIEARLTPKTRAVLFCSPGNPTGVVYTREEMELWRDIAVDHDLFLISDEVYREFVYDGLDHVSAFHLDGLEERAILVDSISKRFSACGARTGCIASRNPQVMASALKFAQARLSPPTLGQLGLIRLLKAEYPRAVEEMIRRFQARRDTLYEELQRIPGVFCRRPEGAFYIIAKLPVADAEDFSRWLLSDFDLDGETVMLAPAEDFYATAGLGADEVRIAYVLRREDLRRAARALREGLALYTDTERHRAEREKVEA